MSYGFGGRLTEAFPSQVCIDVTEVCNLACIHCPHPRFKTTEHYAARFLPVEFSKTAVTEVAAHGAQYMRYCAEGETLLHPDIYDMLADAVERSGTFVTLTTNGTTLDENRLHRLMATGLHMIDVSIDAFMSDTYRTIRGGDLSVVRRNTIKLIERAASTCTNVVVSFIEQKENADEADLFQTFWTDMGADDVVIRRLHSAAGAMPAEHSDGRYPCVYPWERIVISPDGWLKFCPQDWFGGSRVADYRHTTIKETWTGDAYRALRQSHMDGACSGLCKSCPDWAQTRWPHQGGGAYRDLVSRVAAA